MAKKKEDEQNAKYLAKIVYLSSICTYAFSYEFFSCFFFVIIFEDSDYYVTDYCFYRQQTGSDDM